jgi:site-specific DNA-methyltransferase (adenine-specific)/modification methylase
MWSTPAVADADGTRATRGGKRSNEALLTGQARAVTVRSGLPTRTTSTDGSESLNGSLPLSPPFDEWLIGLPIGHTAFEPSAAESRRWLTRMRSEFLRLAPESGTSCVTDAELPELVGASYFVAPYSVRLVPPKLEPEGLFEAREVFDRWRTWAVVQGDVLDVMARLPEKCAAAVLCDPPYNLAPYSTGNIKAKWRAEINNDIAAWDGGGFDPAALLAPVQRVLAGDGNFAAFCAYNLLGKYHAAFDDEFDTFQFAVHHRTNPTPKLRRQGFLNSCELIVFAWNKGHVWNFTKQNEMHNFIETPICCGKERLRRPDGTAVSPTQKPLKVCRWLVEKTTRPGDVVVDPYAGVASMGVACLELGRRYVAVENDPEQVAAARARLSKVRPS